MTANKPGALNQKPLYGCTSCFEDYSWPAEDLRVHDSECWCGQCWEESRWEFPDRPSWSDLEPYTPALQAECERLKATLESLLAAAPDVQGEPVGWQFYQDGKWWHGDDRIKDHRKNTEEAGYLIRDVYAAPQPAEQKPMTDAAKLVEALELALEYWRHRQQRYKNRSPVWVKEARAAIAKAKGTQNE